MILRISLQPLDRFFFGGENSFNEGEREERANDRRASYILHSRYFPQQTGALGLIRNQLLLQRGLLADNTELMSRENRKKARQLIGATNFRKGKEKTYGFIRRISPVYLEDIDGTVIPPAPLDDCLIKEKDQSAQAMTFQWEGEVPYLENYKEKVGLTTQFQHPEKGNESQEQLFLKEKQVGITKAVRPWGDRVNAGDDKSGYYYQEFLAFRQKKGDFPILEKAEKEDEEKEKTSTKEKGPEPKFLISGYTFYVDLSDKEGLEDGIVEFGGERSTFQMKVKKLSEAIEWDALPRPTPQYHHTALSQTAKDAGIRRLVCLTPCLVENLAGLRDSSVFRIIDTLPFRFLQSRFEDDKDTSEGTTNFQQVYRGNEKDRKDGLYESKLFHFLNRGSVIYYTPDQEEDLLQLFDQQDLKTIGYNEIHIIK